MRADLLKEFYARDDGTIDSLRQLEWEQELEIIILNLIQSRGTIEKYSLAV